MTDILKAVSPLRRRMIGIAAAWIAIMLLGGGLALDSVLTNAITRNFDDNQQYVLTSMVAAAEIDALGEVRLNRPLGDQRFLEPYSGSYWQISGVRYEPFRSRSLWDRAHLARAFRALDLAAQEQRGSRGCLKYGEFDAGGSGIDDCYARHEFARRFGLIRQ